MHVATRVRTVLARHPWLHWLAVGAVAAVVAWGAHDRLAAVDDARRSWSETRTVVVASERHDAGDRLTVEVADLPLAAIPVDAIDPAEVDDHTMTARQRIGAREVVTRLDVTAANGPAALADAGSVTVGLTGQPGARPGLPVAVAADGVLIADSARVVAVDADVVFVAVDRRDGPVVAAAAASGLAVLLYLR